MTTITHGKVAFGVNLGSLLSDAKVHAELSGYEKFGVDATARSNFVAHTVNKVIEKFLDAVPVLGSKATELTVDGSRSDLFDLPSDLRGMEFYDLRIEFDDNDDESVPVYFGSKTRMRRVPRNGDSLPSFGESYEGSLTESGTQIRIYPKPPSGSTVVLYHSVQPTAISAANVDSPDGVTIDELPTYARDWAAYTLAAKFAKPVHGREVAKGLEDDADMEMEEVYRKVAGAIGSLGKTRNYDTAEIYYPYGDSQYDTA